VATRLTGRAEAGTAQVALVDRRGRTAVVSGTALERAVSAAEGDHVCVAGNLLERSTTARDALAAVRSSTAGTLAGRLLDGLVAADAGGGDVRGRKSAALRVSTPAASPHGPGVERLVRLRDHRLLAPDLTAAAVSRLR
jgi:uncharacterized Ntn-hydrolase superfamily protein